MSIAAAGLPHPFPDEGGRLTLHVGQTVDVTVSSIKAYGLFCVYKEDTELLVLIPETTWIASFCSCEQFADVGDVITVTILHIAKDSGKIAASVRHRFPDPWTTGALQVGSKHAARVVRYVKSADRCSDGPGYLLELVPGAFVILCASKSELVPGDTCDVTITDSSPDDRAVRVSRVASESG